MELSRAAQLALRTVLDLAIEGPTRTADIAVRRGIPPAQAGKIVQALVRGGIVRSARGARGGVRLSRPAEAVTMRAVIEAIEGPLAIVRCLVWNDCPCDQPCPVRASLTRVQQELAGLLDRITVADLSAAAPRTAGADAVTTPAPNEGSA